jgi:hypothetical protein
MEGSEFVDRLAALADGEAALNVQIEASAADDWAVTIERFGDETDAPRQHSFAEAPTLRDALEDALDQERRAPLTAA